MDKCKSLYIIDKAADFCEQKQILPPPPKKKENYTHCPFILIVYVMFMFYMLQSKWYWSIHSALFFLLGSHLSAETSTMTDSERDQIDEEAEKVIHIVSNISGPD